MGTAIVTGAGTGIGAASARRLAVGGAGFDLGDAAGRVGHEFEDHRVERRLAAPIGLVGLEAQERVSFVGIDLIPVPIGCRSNPSAPTFS